MKTETKQRELKISFQSKEEQRCPVCETSFFREELLSGSGRLIAGPLTDELHRLYEPSAKYGDVYPLAYQATVCPECWFTSMDKDFDSLPASCKDIAFADRDQRVNDAMSILGDVDFRESRDLRSGTASNYLLVRCYEYYPKEFSPTIKQGVASLRTGWLFDEMEKKYPGQHYDWLSTLFKKKACYFYNEAVRREQSGKETLSGMKNFGPDTDKNYGYDGALYLTALLRFKYSFHENQDLRENTLGEAKRTIARIFGLGKSSKNKPGPLLEHAKELYHTINKELNVVDDA
ncbi:MAG: DUF2225 domain-containing protein [Treponema sp.]|nr:DUF2225 domain-containing protein [Treponema sp.]